MTFLNKNNILNRKYIQLITIYLFIKYYKNKKYKIKKKYYIKRIWIIILSIYLYKFLINLQTINFKQLTKILLIKYNYNSNLNIYKKHYLIYPKFSINSFDTQTTNYIIKCYNIPKMSFNCQQLKSYHKLFTLLYKLSIIQRKQKIKYLKKYIYIQNEINL